MLFYVFTGVRGSGNFDASLLFIETHQLLISCECTVQA